MRRVYFAFLALAALALSTPLAVRAEAEGMKIGTVDMQKALQTVDAGKKAKAQLEKEFNAKKKELQAEEASIKKMGEELKKQSLALNEKALAEKQGQIQERIMKFQELTARSQAEIQQKEQELTRPLVGKLRSIVSDMAKQKGYTMVLEKNENTVLFSEEKDDMTSAVIEAFNKQNKG